MSARAVSLRMRLTAIILLPLLVVALLAGAWQVNNARRTASDVFDRSLLSAALAVSNDVAISGGDALSDHTRQILSDTSGGQVFYHVYAPDGVIVAGYATPPVGIPRTSTAVAEPTYFNATYLGRSVSGVRLQSLTQIDGFAGIFTTTVWQDVGVRDAFVAQLVTRSMITISGLILSLAIIVWFGVRHGLRPLITLESAIARRNSDELSPIQRAVPTEVEGIVTTLNRLFAQVSGSMTAQAEFISNAAHQLRNPIAGVLALAEAVNSAPTGRDARTRSADLLKAARATADLSQKLLLLERAKSISPMSAHEVIDLGEALPAWIAAFRDSMAEAPDLNVTVSAGLDAVRCDPTMLEEALLNLLDNATRHGGPQLTVIEVAARRSGDRVTLTVKDNGIGLTPAQIEAAGERFRQIAATSNSGLGISIVEAVARGHDGQFTLSPGDKGLVATLVLPIDGLAPAKAGS